MSQLTVFTRYCDFVPWDEGKIVTISDKYTNKQVQGNKATLLKLALGMGKIVTIPNLRLTRFCQSQLADKDCKFKLPNHFSQVNLYSKGYHFIKFKCFLKHQSFCQMKSVNVSSSLRLFSLERRSCNSRRERPKMTFAEPRPLSVLRQDDPKFVFAKLEGFRFYLKQLY